VDAFGAALAAGDLDRAEEVATALRPGDLRDALLELTSQQVTGLFNGLGATRLAELIKGVEHQDAADVLRLMSDADIAAVLDEFDPDDAADVIGSIKAEAPRRVRPILVEMDRAGDVQALLAFLPDTAGGRMTTEFLAVGPDATADEAMRALRELVAETGDFRGYVYVTDRRGILTGVVPLYRLVLVDPATRVADFMVTAPISVQGTDDQEDVARVFRDRRFLAVPVVDLEGRLIGVVTADDAADVIEKEATEDIERLGGSEPLVEPYLRSSAVTLVKKRVRWLLVLFIAEAYTGTVLRHFAGELQGAVTLAFFIPLLIGTGGNTGTQITTTLTRALGVGEISYRDVWRVWRKELHAAVLLALVMASAAFVRGWTLGVGVRVQLVVALSASAIVLWSATVASILPLVLSRFRLDPAVVSGPLITTVVDGTGLIIYFEIARRLLNL
jgi:magnesium transporter